jgi:hypothetical protein
MKKMHEVRLKVLNSKGKRVNFVLEPWGEIYDFDPSDEFLVVIQGPAEGIPEVDINDESVMVYGWSGSTAQVFRNDEELSPHTRSPVPQFP